MERTPITETPAHLGKEVIIKGWVHARRDMGKIIFIDVRDRSGILQVVVPPKAAALMAVADTLRDEWVVAVHGTVKARPEKMVNPQLVTGKIELVAETITVLNESATPPFPITGDTRAVNEETRLRYRYLDLRSERMRENLMRRDRIIAFFREHMRRHGFLEVETPILMKGTPEGSREYIVPSRLHAGKFYVLPQSPQQFKQLCMVAGLERYFQVARCFRDEDQRGDRQPEFTQLDFEMSFVEQEDVLAFTEAMFIELVRTLFPEKRISSVPFPRLTYAECLERHGTDKPDLRADRTDPDELAFAWIVDFPMFEKDEEGKLAAMHHPFCSVKPEDEPLLGTDPMKVRANAYDLVLNGFELSSGSIRIHRRDLQKRIFDILGISEVEQQSRFGHMLEAFTFGAPPHGGFAPGIDRICMLLSGEENIREVIAFPKTGDARDPMMGAPSELPAKALKEAHIQVKP